MGYTLDKMTGPYKLDVRLDKYTVEEYGSGNAPGDVLVSSQWFEADGTPIDDEGRIAELEEKAREQR